MHPDSATERLGAHATPTLFEVSDAVQALAPGIAPLYRPITLWGVACTVMTAPGDNLPVHLALEQVAPGAVLVVVTGGCLDRGFWGEVLTVAAQARGVRGLVTDGAVRDTAAIRALGFPVFSAGVAIAGTVKLWPGALNQPVTLGGALIRPGDLLVGDDDGVVVVPPAAAEDVLAGAEARVQREAMMMERLRAGELTVDLLNLRGKMINKDS